MTSIGGVTAQPGTLKYKDLNGDNTINNSDRTIISNSNPKFAAGFSNEFQLHGFFMNLFFQGVYGNQIMNGFTTMVESGGGDATANLTKEYWINKWTPDNPSNRYASTIATNTDNQILSDEKSLGKWFIANTDTNPPTIIEICITIILPENGL